MGCRGADANGIMGRGRSQPVGVVDVRPRRSSCRPTPHRPAALAAEPPTHFRPRVVGRTRRWSVSEAFFGNSPRGPRQPQQRHNGSRVLEPRLHLDASLSRALKTARRDTDHIDRQSYPPCYRRKNTNVQYHPGHAPPSRALSPRGPLLVCLSSGRRSSAHSLGMSTRTSDWMYVHACSPCLEFSTPTPECCVSV